MGRKTGPALTLFGEMNPEMKGLLREINRYAPCHYGGESGEEPVLCDAPDRVYVGMDRIRSRVKEMKC